MNIKDILRLLKVIYIIVLPLFAAWYLIMYWNAELVVDKVHYGIFMLAFMILMLDLDITHNSGNRNNTASN